MGRVFDVESPPDPASRPAPPGISRKEGQRVGSYRLIEPLGSGGMGEVWLAQHQMLDRLAAVKLIRAAESSPNGSEQARKRFEREARATSALRSPHTIAIYDFGVTPDLAFYYAMELLDGIGLDVLVERFGPVSAGRAVHILRGACESLAEAHQRGVVHRDIKPSNVFVSTLGLTSDFVKVLDFGLVKQLVPSSALTSLTATGALAGSPAFMPPEAVLGEFTGQTDVYSLGCVAYWLLTGRYLFKGVTAFEMMLAHVNSEPDRPSVHLEHAPPAPLEDLIMRCLAKSPAARPTIREVLARLAEIAASHPWTAADADSWWEQHSPSLIAWKLVLSEAHRERLRGDALARRERGELNELERETRAQASLARLQQHFLHSHIDMESLELRIARVKQATAVEEFDIIFADLPELSGANEGATRGLGPAAGEQALAAQGVRPLAAPRANVLCVMTHLTRHCTIEPGKEVRAFSMMGYCVLELSGGSMAKGVMKVACTALMGGLEIIIPGDLRVEIVSGGLMGAFEQEGTFAVSGSEDRTVIQVHGSVVMGLVMVRARHRPAE